jgi:hypothetical protein
MMIRCSRTRAAQLDVEGRAELVTGLDIGLQQGWPADRWQPPGGVGEDVSRPGIHDGANVLARCPHHQIEGEADTEDLRGQGGAELVTGLGVVL